MPEEADRLLQLHILNLGGELRRMFSVMSTMDWPEHSEPRSSRVTEMAGSADR